LPLSVWDTNSCTEIISEVSSICLGISAGEYSTAQATEETTTVEATASTAGDTQTVVVVTQTNGGGSPTVVTSTIYTASTSSASGFSGLGNSGSSSGLSTGATAGIAVGAVLGSITLCVVAFLLYKFCIKKQPEPPALTVTETSAVPTTGPTAQPQRANLTGMPAGAYQPVPPTGPIKQAPVHSISPATSPSTVSAVPIPPPGYSVSAPGQGGATELHANAWHLQPTELQAGQGGLSPPPPQHLWAGSGQYPPVPLSGAAAGYAQPVRSEMAGDVHVRPELQGQPYEQVRPELQGQPYEQVRPELQGQPYEQVRPELQGQPYGQVMPDLHGQSYGQEVYEMPAAARVGFPPRPLRNAGGSG
jgi:hypothetical protein